MFSALHTRAGDVFSGMRAILCALSLLFLLAPTFPTCSGSQDVQTPAFEAVSPNTVGGEPADRGRFPYVCSLHAGEGLEHKCAGTLIRERWVVTAAHCVDPKSPDFVGEHPVVYCGSYESDKNQEKMFNAVGVHIHELWIGYVSEGNDIAMIKLDSDADCETPKLDIGSNEVKAEQFFWTLGWEETTRRSSSKNLRISQRLSYVAPKTCKDSWGSFLPAGDVLCAEGGESDTYKGDSGSPLIVSSPDGDFHQGQTDSDTLFGIASFGVDEDDTHKPGVYTQLRSYAHWIEKVIQDDRVGVETASAPLEPPQQQPDVRHELEGLSSEDLLEEMMKAMHNDDGLSAEAILSKGLDVNSKYDDQALYTGWDLTLLHWAAVLDAAECAKVLIDHDADVEARATDGYTPLMMAALNQASPSVSEILLEHEANVDAKTYSEERTALHIAANHCRFQVPSMIMEHKANVDENGVSGLGPIRQVSANTHTPFSVNQMPSENFTGANTASSYVESTGSSSPCPGTSENPCLKVLIRYNPDLNARDERLWTPLHVAASQWCKENVEILLASGADKTLRAHNENPYGVICEERPCQPSCCQYLGNKLCPFYAAFLRAGCDLFACTLD